MILLQAAPDAAYFYWQLEIQLFNFKKLGIDLNKVHHVIVGNNEMSDEFIVFKEKYPEVNICWYKDTRASRRYIPSLRPNGIKQHFEAFPELINDAIFYHDADIIFNKLPNFDELIKDDVWYLSDTNSYINADYIKSKGSSILDEMCSIVGVDKSAIESINSDSGGAQYILKGTDFAFWDKVESDCEKLYSYMVDSIPHWAAEYVKNTGMPEHQYHPIQAWTADMWVVLWNGVRMGKQVKVVNEMAFCWATDPIEVFNARNIFHNAGVTENDRARLFYKGDYIYINPFPSNFEYVDRNYASYAYIQEMQDYVKSKSSS